MAIRLERQSGNAREVGRDVYSKGGILTLRQRRLKFRLTKTAQTSLYRANP